MKAPEKKMKLVKIKQAVDETSVISHEYPPLIDKLLEYFSQPINYTLTGYVSKILLNMLNRKTDDVLPT